MLLLQCICVGLTSIMIGQGFHLYNSDVSNDEGDYRDCVYSFHMKSKTNEWQLVPYCIRHKKGHSGNHEQVCDSIDSYTFEQLKAKNIDGDHLYEWRAPIDVINDYQKYLVSHDMTFATRLYCNCSGKTVL